MTSVEDLQNQLRTGEALRFHTPLRRGGVVGITDTRLLVQSAEAATTVSLGSIDEATIEEFDWFLGVLSVLLVGFGFLSISRNALFAAVFTGLGVVSLYWTYRKRGKVQIQVHDRPKPLTFSLDATEEFYDRLERALDQYEPEADAGSD